MNRLAAIFLLLAVNALAQPFTVQDIAFLGKVGGPTDWELRVLANGGAQPSQNTVNAMETFRLGMISAGLTSKMHSVCIFVPDSLIAALTPIFKHKGSDPWTNFNFVVGDLTIDGLKGDGSTKYLGTGVKAKSGEAVNSSGGSCGLTVLVSESYDNTSGIEVGHADSGLTKPLSLGISTTTVVTAGRTAFLTRGSTEPEMAVATDWRRSGVVCANSLNSNLVIYIQSPLLAHTVLATNDAVTTSATSSEETIVAFARNTAGTIEQYSGKRLSVVAIHDGLTPTEAENFSSLLIALRTSLGGGTGDEIENWAMRVVSNGGTAPSAGTKSALRSFYSGLISNNILTNSVIHNLVAPDNLVAARMPLVWKVGSEVWTNFNFDATNLTVNGLTGNGTSKYLGTGIIPSTTQDALLRTTNAGISLVIVTNVSTGKYNFGTGGSGNSQPWALLNNAGNTILYCWEYTGINADSLNASGAQSIGFFAGNRTAVNALALYQANSVTSHAVVTNGTGSATGVIPVAHPMFAFAVNINGSPLAWSDHTVSYFGLHSGFTQTQSSNLFRLVYDARTALGGGAP